jgi:hypothetical protein
LVGNNNVNYFTFYLLTYSSLLLDPKINKFGRTFKVFIVKERIYFAKV